MATSETTSIEAMEAEVADLNRRIGEAVEVGASTLRLSYRLREVSDRLVDARIEAERERNGVEPCECARAGRVCDGDCLDAALAARDALAASIAAERCGDCGCSMARGGVLLGGEPERNALYRCWDCVRAWREGYDMAGLEQRRLANRWHGAEAVARREAEAASRREDARAQAPPIAGGAPTEAEAAQHAADAAASEAERYGYAERSVCVSHRARHGRQRWAPNGHRRGEWRAATARLRRRQSAEEFAAEVDAALAA